MMNEKVLFLIFVCILSEFDVQKEVRVGFHDNVKEACDACHTRRKTDNRITDDYHCNFFSLSQKIVLSLESKEP